MFEWWLGVKVIIEFIFLLQPTWSVGALRECDGWMGWVSVWTLMVTQVKPLCILVLVSGTHFHELHPSKFFVKGSLLYMTETNKIQRLINLRFCPWNWGGFLEDFNDLYKFIFFWSRTCYNILHLINIQCAFHIFV